ncbi:Ig-like domain-containing protein [Actinoplanes sp. NPDC089786]|uniref:Ig-like domain-containing protein n=1 Tax=Actinoplanes sp. NPDC089786 TaxID=3155185 RepID=UPI00342FD9B8
MIRRLTAVVVAVMMLTVGSATPASAADEGPVVLSTGLTEGQLVPAWFRLDPVVSGDIVRAYIFVNGSLRRTVPRWPSTSTGVYMYEKDGPEATVRVRVVDTEDRVADATTRVRVDATKLAIAIQPPARTIVHGPTTITVTPDAEDVAEIVMMAGGVSGEVLERRTEAPWVFERDFTATPGDVRFRAVDRAGNYTYQDPTFIIDNEGPSIGHDEWLFTRPGPNHLKAVFPWPGDAVRVEWWVDGVRCATQDDVICDFGTTIRVVTAEIRAWDRLGNMSSRVFQVQLDNTGPRASSATPTQRTLVRGTSFTSTITAADQTGIESVYADGLTYWVKGNNGVYSHVFKVLIQDGVYVYSWMLHDNLGNKSELNRMVIMDNTRPRITKVTAPASGAKVPATVKTSMSATDLNGIQRVELRVNGKLVLSDTKAPYALNLNATRYGKSFTVAFYAIDRAGNIVSTSRRTWKR